MKQKRYKKIMFLLETNPSSELLETAKVSYPEDYAKAFKLVSRVSKPYYGRSNSTIRRNKARKALKGIYE